MPKLARLPSGGKLSKGKKVVTEDDFIVDDDEVESDPSESSSSDEEASSNGKGEAERLEEDWLGWADGSNVEEKLRHELHRKGMLPIACCQHTTMPDPLLRHLRMVRGC